VYPVKSQTESFANNASRTPTKPIWVSPKEASRLTAIGLTRLYALLNDNTLKSIKLGRKRLVSYASLEALAERRD
jgi:excisionase family DNA binding protein